MKINITATKIISIYIIENDYVLVPTDDKWHSERDETIAIAKPTEKDLFKSLLQLLSQNSPSENTPKWHGKYKGKNLWEETDINCGITIYPPIRSEPKYKVVVDKFIWSSFGKQILKFTGTYKGSDGVYFVDKVDETVLSDIVDFIFHAGE